MCAVVGRRVTCQSVRSVSPPLVTTNDRRLTLGALTAYVVLVNLYNDIHTATLLFLHRGQAQVLLNLPDWAFLYRLFQPSEAY